MGRKNGNAKRPRLNRRERGESRPTMTGNSTYRVSLTALVLPDGTCRFQGKPKAMFSTEAKAAKALRQAQKQRERTGSGHVEKRYYACPEGGCGGFHLTSRETFDEKAWRERKVKS